MKTLKRMKTIAILLFVAVIIFASFFGVYKKEDFRTVNLIKGYNLGMQFTNAKVLKMTVSKAENEVIYDSEGNLIENDGKTEYTEENGYKVETIKVNSEDVLTEENYKITKKIMKNRLKGMKTGEYKLELNNETGEITVKLQENDEMEEVFHHLKQKGEFNIIDTETKEILLNNNHVKSAKLVYGPSDEIGTSTIIYLQIDFNDEGTKKLEEISKIYVKTTEQKENEAGEKEEVDTTKYVSVLLDGTTYSSTYFGETNSEGSLYVPITEVSDNETMEQVRKELEHIVTIINNGILPIEYEYAEETIEPQIDKNILFIGILVPAVVLLIACIVLIVKFKAQGFILTFLQIGYIALLLLVVRYTNVVLTVEGIIGIGISAMLNYMLVYTMLNDLKKKQQLEWGVIRRFVLKTIPLYILAIILAFNSLTRVNSLGMTLVWGSIVLYIYNFAITRIVLKMMRK